MFVIKFFVVLLFISIWLHVSILQTVENEEYILLCLRWTIWIVRVVFVEDQTVNVSTVSWREQTTFWWNVMIIIMSTLYQWTKWILFWTIPEHANSNPRVHVSLHSDTYPDPEPNIYMNRLFSIILIILKKTYTL